MSAEIGNKNNETATVLRVFSGVIKKCSNPWENRFDLGIGHHDCYAPLFVYVQVYYTEYGTPISRSLKDVFHLIEHEGGVEPECQDSCRFTELLHAVGILRNGDTEDVNPYEPFCEKLVGKFVTVHVTDKGLIYKPFNDQTSNSQH